MTPPVPAPGSYQTGTPGWIIAGVGGAALASGVIIFLTGNSSGTTMAVSLTPTSLLLERRF